jgi:predicted AAA+ superfamily ATPase
MQRIFSDILLGWKRQPARKPLVVKGARQTGKTYAIRQFGRSAYDALCEVNFEASPRLATVFEADLNPRRIVQDLALLARFDPAAVLAGQALLFLDEVQACPKAITSLKYFHEQLPHVHVAAAGSLLGVELARASSFPTGKVELRTLQPLDVHEFLAATGRSEFRDRFGAIDSIKPLGAGIHAELIAALREYLYVGGMPEAVAAFAENRDWARVRRIQNDIIAAYRLDFAKHAPAPLVPRLVMIWDSLPEQLARENRRFLFSAVREGARAREYEEALLWLEQAGLVHRACAVQAPRLPLAAYCNRRLFKLFALDVGLLGAAAGLAAEAVLHGNDVFQEFKGALAEQYVAQQLVAQEPGGPDRRLFYWRNEKTGTEVDFLLEDSDVIPLEVKSGHNARSKSLASYGRQFGPRCLARATLLDLKADGNVLNVPLYLVPMIDRLLRLRP